MGGDEFVVVEVWVGESDSIDFRELARAEGFVSVEAPETLQQPLASQDFVEARDAAAEAVRRVEEGGLLIFALFHIGTLFQEH